MDMVTRVQIVDKVFCISHSSNVLKKGMKPTILRPAMDKLKDRLYLGVATGLEVGKLLIQIC